MRSATSTAATGRCAASIRMNAGRSSSASRSRSSVAKNLENTGSSWARTRARSRSARTHWRCRATPIAITTTITAVATPSTQNVSRSGATTRSICAPHMRAAPEVWQARGSSASAGRACRRGRDEMLVELHAARDVELLEDVGEVGLDGAARDVEVLGDLAVAVALRREAGDAMFRRSERVDAGERRAPRASTRGAELVAGAAGETAHVPALGEVERESERLAGVSAAAGAPQRGSQVDERARVLETTGRVPSQPGGALEQHHALVPGHGAGES